MTTHSFKSWLLDEEHLSVRYTWDTLSRIKAFERETGISLDTEYEQDHCEHLMSLFKRLGSGFSSITHGQLPIGSRSIINYSLAIRKYIKYRDYLKTKSKKSV